MPPRWRFHLESLSAPQEPPASRTLLIGQRTRHVRFNKARSNNVYSNTAGRNSASQ